MVNFKSVVAVITVLSPLALIAGDIVLASHASLLNRHGHDFVRITCIVDVLFVSLTLMGIGGALGMAVWEKRNIWIATAFATGAVAFGTWLWCGFVGAASSWH